MSDKILRTDKKAKAKAEKPNGPHSIVRHGSVTVPIYAGKTGKVLHITQQCFNGKLNGGCGVVCCVTTPSNIRGRHSQAPAKRRIQSAKAEGFCRAKPIAVSGRSPQPLSSGRAYKSPAEAVVRQMTKFYAAGPLDSGEERASSHLHGPFTAQNPHKFC